MAIDGPGQAQEHLDTQSGGDSVDTGGDISGVGDPVEIPGGQTEDYVGTILSVLAATFLIEADASPPFEPTPWPDAVDAPAAPLPDLALPPALAA